MEACSNCCGDCARCERALDCPARLASRRAPILCSQAGDIGSSRADGGFGFAADIGSTTLAIALYDLATGRELAAAGARNPQADISADVIGRVSAAESPEGLSKLKGILETALDELISQTCERSGISPKDLVDGVVAGNAVMLHILTARSPSSLARAPFKADWLAGCEENVCGIRAFLAPATGAFTGADLTCAMIAAGFDAPGPATLLLDIGTNAEIALRVGSRVYAASTAAGPAFEGAGGGICGTRILELMARYVRSGDIAPCGTLSSALSLSGECALSQITVSAVQTAKAAVAAGISVMLEEAGLSAGDIEEIVLAGGFGSFLDAADAITVGMLPYAPRAKSLSIGNAALTGCASILLHPSKRESALDLAARTQVVPLGGDKRFSVRFIDSLPLSPARHQSAAQRRK